VTQFECAAREAEHGSRLLRQALLEVPVPEALDAPAEPRIDGVAAVSPGPESR
jgi:hypothetical protein